MYSAALAAPGEPTSRPSSSSAARKVVCSRKRAAVKGSSGAIPAPSTSTHVARSMGVESGPTSGPRVGYAPAGRGRIGPGPRGGVKAAGSAGQGAADLEQRLGPDDRPLVGEGVEALDRKP